MAKQEHFVRIGAAVEATEHVVATLRSAFPKARVTIASRNGAIGARLVGTFSIVDAERIAERAIDQFFDGDVRTCRFCGGTHDDYNRVCTAEPIAVPKPGAAVTAAAAFVGARDFAVAAAFEEFVAMLRSKFPGLDDGHTDVNGGDVVAWLSAMLPVLDRATGRKRPK